MNIIPRIAVILANWNGARFLDKAIESVVTQTYRDWILICVDTASSDGSCKILTRWAATDSRVKTLLLPKRLIYPEAINAGLRHAQGEFIARIESDDLWHPTKLERQMAFLTRPENEAVGVCGTDALLIDDNGAPSGIKRFPRTHEGCVRNIWYRNPFCHSSVLMRRAALGTCGTYNERRYLVEDLDLWFRVAAKWRLVNMPETLVSYRIWWGALTSSRLRAITWRSYRLRTHEVQAYGYRCSWAARIYSLASLATALFPAPVVIKLFHSALRFFGPREAAFTNTFSVSPAICANPTPMPIRPVNK